LKILFFYYWWFLFKRGYYISEIEKELVVKKNSDDDWDFLEEIYTREHVEKFVYGTSFSEGFLKTDANENLFLFNSLFIILS